MANTKTFNLNNVGAKTLVFNINRTPFTLRYNDDSLLDLVMVSNDVKKVIKQYQKLEKKINDNDAAIERSEVVEMFSTMKSALMGFFDKAFGHGQAQKLYETVGSVVLGGLTSAFDLIADAINEQAAGGTNVSSVKGVKPNVKPYRKG